MSKIELSPRSVRILSAVILAATFVLGMAAGAALWHSVMRGPFGPPMQRDMPPPMRGLDLTPKQREAFDGVFEKYRPKLDEILSASFPKIRAVKAEMDKELRALLEPEQQKRFDEMMEELPPPIPPPGFSHHFLSRPPGPFGGREDAPPLPHGPPGGPMLHPHRGPMDPGDISAPLPPRPAAPPNTASSRGEEPRQDEGASDPTKP